MEISGLEVALLGHLSVNRWSGDVSARLWEYGSTLRAVMASTKRLKLKQQSRRRYAANGFAFVPHTCRFLGRHPLGCRADGEQCRCFYLQSDRASIASAQSPASRFCEQQNVGKFHSFAQKSPEPLPVKVYSQPIGRGRRPAAMSALPPKADIAERDCDVRFVPKADIPAQKEKGPAQWPVPPIARTSLW